LVLPGVADLDTLDLASRLVGEEEVDKDSTTVDSAGRRSATSAAQWRRLLPPESARRLGDGEAVLLYGNLAPARLRLRPWYGVRALRRRAALEVPATNRPPVGADDRADAGTTSTVQTNAATAGGPVSILDAARARRRHHGGDPA
jgi:type IV secretory pathway TraG/TraD family ATPase VirD4